MAINGLVHSGAEAKWGWSQESTFGTKLASSTNYILAESPIPTVDYGVFQDQSVKHRGQRYADKNDSYVTVTGMERRISFSDWKVRRADLAELVYAVTQTVSEAVGDPYQKDFDISTSTTQPNFASNAGYFATIFIDDVISGNGKVFASCILASLTLSADMVGGDGRLMASGEWLSGFTPNTSETLSGTPTWNTQTYYNYNAPSAKTIASNDIVLYGWELTINNNAKKIGSNSSGYAETYAIGIPEYEVTGSLTVKYDANTHGRLESWLNGTAEAIQLSVGSAGAAGYFDIQVPNAEYTGHEVGYDDEKGMIITLPFKAMGNASSSDLLNLQIDDGTDQTW